MASKKRWLRGVLVVALLLPLWATTRPAGAVPFDWTCQGAGLSDVNYTPLVTSWSLDGGGTCTGDYGGPYLIEIDGEGTSAGAGLCGGGVVANLAIDVTITLTSIQTGVVRTIEQEWRAPLALYPFVTTFQVYVDGQPAGHGRQQSRIFGECPPDGFDGATWEWEFREG